MGHALRAGLSQRLKREPGKHWAEIEVWGTRSVRDYLNGSNKNTGNHWVEIEVWGVRTTAYVGAHYEKDVTANTGTSYYYLGGQRIGVRRGGVLYYLHADHLGSASLMPFHETDPEF